VHEGGCGTPGRRAEVLRIWLVCLKLPSVLAVFLGLYCHVAAANTLSVADSEKLSNIAERMNALSMDIGNAFPAEVRARNETLGYCADTMEEDLGYLADLAQRYATEIYYESRMLYEEDQSIIDIILRGALPNVLKRVDHTRGSINRIQGRCSSNALMVLRAQQIVSLIDEMKTALTAVLLKIEAASSTLR
jgi:hypothetical protein